MQATKNAPSTIPVPLEAAVWLTGLAALALMPSQGPPLDLCLLHRLGVEFCPGCGLGRSIRHFLHAEPRAALAAHPLGPFAAVVLMVRSLRLIARGVAWRAPVLRRNVEGE